MVTVFRCSFIQLLFLNFQVLNVRRALFNLALELTPDKESTKPLREMLKSELGECWILAAKVARKAGQVRHIKTLLL